MHKFMLPAALATALGFAFLPAAQASWLSEAMHRNDNDGRDVRYLPPAPQYGYTVRYAPAYGPQYAPPAQPAPGYVAAYPGLADPVAVGYGDQIVGVTDRLAAELRNLREDVAVELPDARGRALAGQADDMLEQIEHLQKSVRSGASPEHLQEHAADLAKSLHEFLEATEGLGRDGRFLNRAATRIHDLDHVLLRLLGPANNP